MTVEEKKLRERKLRKIGEKGYILLQNLLAEELPYLAPVIFAMPGKADDGETGMSTDGQMVFYNPGFLVEKLGNQKKGYSGLKKCYLHIIAHCLLGHIGQTAEDADSIWDGCCDLIAELLVSDMLGTKRSYGNRNTEKLMKMLDMLGAESLYQLVKEAKSEKHISRIGQQMVRDDHARWKRSRREEMAAGNAADRRCNEEMAAGNTADSSRKIQEMWNRLYGQIWQLMPQDQADKFGYGLQFGDESRSITAAAENKSDYRKILEKYTLLAEQRTEDLDSLDLGWYALGMELYGNIPLIEYPESSEKQSVDEIVIAVDTSGSCDGETAQRFLRETCNMIRDMGIGRTPVNLRILECDESIQNEIVIHCSDDVPDFEKREMIGFGGTSFVPVFKRIEELRKSGEMPRVRCLLYLTDGMGDFPELEPDYDVIFVLEPDPFMESHCIDWDKHVPKWVRRIYLTRDDLKEE